MATKRKSTLIKTDTFKAFLARTQWKVKVKTWFQNTESFDLLQCRWQFFSFPWSVPVLRNWGGTSRGCFYTNNKRLLEFNCCKPVFGQGRAMKSFSGFTLVEIHFLYSKLKVSGSHEIFLGAFPVYKIFIICKKIFSSNRNPWRK